MQKKVREYIQLNQMLCRGDRLVVGVSGGADSVCLLAILKALRQEYALSLYVVHVNHGIRKEAVEDAQYVKWLCQQWDIPCYSYEYEIPVLATTWKMSEEEAGRKVRYQCFVEVANQVCASKIVTAHHLGDQAETVLFHLIRGTNLSGMVGIRPVGEMQDKIILRPLLCVSKTEIIDYLKSQQIQWKEDVTNQQNDYTRNKLRNQVIPMICEMNEQAVAHIAAFAQVAAQQYDFFQKVVAKYFNENVNIVWEDCFTCDCEKQTTLAGMSCNTNRMNLISQEQILAKAVIYEMLAKVSGSRQDITSEHVQAVYQLLYNQSGKRVMLPCEMEAENVYENVVIRKTSKEGFGTYEERCRISFNKNQQICLSNGEVLDIRWINKSNVSKQEWKNLLDMATNSKNIYTKLFDCDKIEDTLCVRHPGRDDFFIMNEAGNRKKLSRYFMDCKVSKNERQQQYVIATENEVLWIVGGRRCEAYKITEDTSQILMVSYEGDKNGKTSRSDDF